MASSTSSTTTTKKNKAPDGDRRAAINNMNQDYCKFLVDYYYKTLVVNPSQQPYGCWIPNKLPSSKDGGYVKITIKREDYERALGLSSSNNKMTRSQKQKQQMMDKLFNDGDEKNIYLHVISYKATNGTCPDGVHTQVSHMCHVQSCFNPDHLVSESAYINNQRKNCTRALLLPPNVTDVKTQGLRIVVRTCNGHGTTNMCIMPIIYNDTKNYKVVNPDTTTTMTTTVPQTVLGKGGHHSKTRKVSWDQWLHKKRREEEAKEEEEEAADDDDDDDDVFEKPRSRKKPKVNDDDDVNKDFVIDNPSPPPPPTPKPTPKPKVETFPYNLDSIFGYNDEDDDEEPFFDLRPRKKPKTS